MDPSDPFAPDEIMDWIMSDEFADVPHSCNPGRGIRIFLDADKLLELCGGDLDEAKILVSLFNRCFGCAIGFKELEFSEWFKDMLVAAARS